MPASIVTCWMPLRIDPAARPRLRQIRAMRPRASGSPATSSSATIVSGRGASGGRSSTGGSAANGCGASAGSQRAPTHMTPARGSWVSPVGEPLREGEHLEHLVAGDERVRPLGRAMDEDVTGADLVQDVVLPAESRARQHEEDLLLVDVHVQRHRPAAGGDPVTAQADVARARGGGQPLALAAQIAVLVRRPRNVVDVTEHLERW